MLHFWDSYPTVMLTGHMQHQADWQMLRSSTLWQNTDGDAPKVAEPRNRPAASRTMALRRIMVMSGTGLDQGCTTVREL